MTTPITGETAVTIRVPAQDLYDYLLDFTRHPEWVQNLSKVSKVSGGPVGVGSIFEASDLLLQITERAVV